MPDSIKRTEHIWMFGKRYDFNVYESSIALNVLQYHSIATNPDRKQKNQIVLHYTAGNNPAQNTIDAWNGLVKTIPKPPKPRPKESHASAHYILELAQDRSNPSAQNYSDVIEVIDSDYVTFHAGVVNDNSIGIEITNVGWDFAKTKPKHESMSGKGKDRRPTDRNRWLHLRNPRGVGPDTNLGSYDFQAYQEEQYLAMILLLRSLCIKHRIPRRFLGETTHEKMKRWWHNLSADEWLWRSKLMRFRGILSHMNVHYNTDKKPWWGKECGGPALHRNCLFRGIIDEWWMPVELDGRERPYYMGPFDPQPNVPSYFRWVRGVLRDELFHDADLDALQETRSYYDLNKKEWYYANTETAHEGGTFPIGKNKVWHGGIHLSPLDSNRKVYAAASGTIVAARLGGDPAVEQDPKYGSQRFILIRHTVYYQQEADPGGGTRINYTNDPTYFFTLYMHLAALIPPADISSVNRNNPHWFNYWRRRNPAADANQVFFPDVQVSVGDWIGECGIFQGRCMIHFEVMSREELTISPWDDKRYRAYDPGTDVLVNTSVIERFVTDIAGDGVDVVDILRVSAVYVDDILLASAVGVVDILRKSALLRQVKSYHKSEWALSSKDDLAPVVPEARREGVWNALQHFMWIKDAVAVYPDLKTQLCDEKGFFWHYHPITFMDFINRLILEENGEVSEPDYRNTNVVIEGGFLTRYVNFTAGTATPAPADNERLQPFDVSSNLLEYRFTRADLACQGAGSHNPGPTPPDSTRFSLKLLDVLENIHRKYGSNIRVNLSHLCSEHSSDTPANWGRCVLGTVDALAKHANGIAVDISPTAPNPGRCRSLWNATKDINEEYNDSSEEYAGDPSRPDLTGGGGELMVSTMPAIQAKLEAGTPLTLVDAKSCILHIELTEVTTTIIWECWIRKPSRAIRVKLHDSGIIGVFNTQAEADAEKDSDVSWLRECVWECWIKSRSNAIQVKVYNSGIIGVFNSRDEAESEKETGYAWPKER